MAFAKLSKAPVIASGGVSSVEDLKALKKNNIYGVIVGRALYDNKIKITELFNICK